ncbi:MAG TPA: DUF2917 domain-containing protein [Anaerolineales bacterium]|nr:DUF2917 domain-containing protein [Anaerolineales bacterium]
MLRVKEYLHILTDISLAKFQTWTIGGDRRGDVISCVDGTLWITQEGDLKDYVVETGKDFWVTKPGTLVVQALDNSRFKYNLNEIQNHLEDNRQLFHRLNRVRLPRSLR